MLNQSNYFNYVLTYLDQGGNNVWWSANSIVSSQALAELIINGNGIEEDCILEECNPICSTIIESEQQATEVLNKEQKLIYPTFLINPNKLTIRLNNLDLVEQPNYIEENCVNNECIDEFGIWTKAITTNKTVDIEGDTYYFIKANSDRYGYSYIYKVSLIHEETGEEIVIIKQKGLTSSEIVWNQEVPLGFNPCIIITKFDIEQVITTYKFVSNPLYLRSDWNTNLPWQPLNNNTEEVLLSILLLLHTDLEIINDNELVLYKQKQQTLINVLLKTINSISTLDSNPYSYIKNVTSLIEYNSLVTNNLNELENIGVTPGIYSTITYEEDNQTDLISILLLLVISKINDSSLNTILNTYIQKCIDIQTNSLKEEVLRLIALIEAYKITKDVYHLSIGTTAIENIIKLYKIEDGNYIESLDNPIQTVQSKVYGDLFEVYTTNKQIDIKDYILEQIVYIDNLDNYIYLTSQPTLLTSLPSDLLILKLIGIDLDYNLVDNTKLIIDVLKLKTTNSINNKLLNSLDLYKQDVFIRFKNYIPIDFGWLSETTPIQDLIIFSITKPIIDLYIHSKYIQDLYFEKEALTNSYTNKLITNTKELLPLTIETDKSLINVLWPGKYSNSIDLEIKGYYDSDIISEINNNIKTLGVETNLVSALEMPLISNFDLCFDIVKLEDYRCQVDINGQLILLNDGQCDLAPPEVAILLQENISPVTQETSINDYFIL